MGAMNRKAGDLPAWGQFVIGVAIILFSAGAAWGGASYKIRELDQVKADVTATRGEMTATRRDVAAMRLSTCALTSVLAAKAPAADLRLYDQALKACDGVVR